jgi:hypothetical protein
VSRRGALLQTAIACALATATAAAGADLERVQAVGAAPIARAGGGAVRQSALEAGVREAVLQVGAEVAGETGRAPDPTALKAALGNDLLAYAARFRLIEDRGEHPALLIQDPGVEREYEVMVEVEVDRARVRASLAKAGLLAAGGSKPGAAPLATLEVTFEGVDSYATWEALRRALGGRPGAVRPLEFARRRVLAQVDSDEAPEALVERLRHGVGDSFGIALRSAAGQHLEIEVIPGPAAAVPPAGAPPGAAAPPPAKARP